MKLLIFDFDGTIGDTAGLIIKTMQQTMHAMQLPVLPPETCATTIGLPLAQCFTHILPISEEKGEQCAACYRELFEHNKNQLQIRMFPHVKETLRTLHERGFVLTIATSRQRPSLVHFLEQMGVLSCFSYLVTVLDVEQAKPAPDMVIKTLRHFGVEAQDALVIGDTRFDILMGQRAGAHTCGVTWGNCTRAELEEAGAESIIDDMQELASSLSLC